MLGIRTAWLKQIPLNHVAIVLSAVTTYILHGSALSGSWRYDDGLHLQFAANYSPWQYFFIPEITRLQSGANVTPWNVFFYDVNLWLFGLTPKWFYAHQLVVVWLSSIATFFFLRLWIGAGWALFGAILFLSNAATVHIAQELMTGHYAAGLLFTILALYGYMQSIREQDWRPALIGSFFYLLAVTCKEIYVPLIGILFFLPEGELRSRLRFSLPYGLVGLLYIPWRFAVLNGNLGGGYKTGFFTNPSLGEFGQIVKTFFLLPQLLLAGETIAYAILLTVSLSYFCKKRNRLPLLIAGLLLVSAPLAPLWTALDHIERLFFLYWWGLSIYITILLSTWEKPQPIRALLAIGFLALSLQTAYAELHASIGQGVRDCHDKVSNFILNSNAEQVFFDSLNVWYPASHVVVPVVEVEKKLHPSSPRRAFVTYDPNVLKSFLLTKASIWTYSDRCRCMENITSTATSFIRDFESKQIERPLFLNVKYEENMVLWEVGPYSTDGVYEIVIGESNIVSLPGLQGKVAFDKSRTLEFYLRYRSPSGWIARSPPLYYAPASNPVLTWSRQ